ncbi:uncharacterized protein LOC119631943 isoform X2 [Glossina fuscipes]|uniref:Uncharacterized protein LOC119631943 isoform X2 n=1 Tax=Glossina fuscipes TaxID=7396 RepID=A0A8U0W5M3_9MUSC|nr:uncharacterized protein LOC119631943 isoform X2 [Glossina fuscipes]
MKESVKESHKLIKDGKQTEHSKAIKNSSRDINKNILNDRNDRSRSSLNSPVVWYETKKPFRWRPLAWRRKQWLLLLSLAIFVFLVNATLNHLDNGDPDNASDLDRDGDEKNFRLQHLHSHVPGMKAVQLLSQHFIFTSRTATTTEHKPRITTNDLTLNLSSSSSFSTSYFTENVSAAHNSHIPPPPTGYLVWSERCKMPNLDPYLPEMMRHFKREKYKPCHIETPLTRIEFNQTFGRYTLRINQELVKVYSKKKPLDCCYQTIERNSTGGRADCDVSLSECLSFRDRTPLASTIDNILVTCRANRKQIYRNGHPLMPERPDIRERLSAWKRYDKTHNRKKPPNVLMIGIDSISRINLIRAMPKTAQYLYDNEWFELSGYNKIDDNTFPNLMAILTGLNKTTALKRCKPTVLHGLDNCNFIWHTFRKYGYVTAYAEDEASINTFNYLKVGFEQPPADYYLRPFLLSAEQHLQVKLKSNLIYCLGYQHSADYVYEYALELSRRYRNDTYFGLFWTNTFSHNAISDCTSMDGRMVEYLKRFADSGTLNDTIVIFFSDHGMRYGPTRKTNSGHLEERLPFIFLWLPQQLKQEYPSFVSALSTNKNRLTNPYDLHMTLKHILALTGRVKNKLDELAPSESCPRCQSLLKPVPYNRSCDDVAIEAHWCTCLHYQSIYKNSKTVVTLTHLLIDHINDYVENFQNKSFAKLCVPLTFDHVESAYRSQLELPDKQTDPNTYQDIYRILFYTKPNKALFEATAIYNSVTGYMKVTGEISRLNSYSHDSECVSDGGAKKYCSCHKKKIF